MILFGGLYLTVSGQVGDTIPIPTAHDSATRVTENVDFLFQWLFEGTEDSEDTHEELIEDYLFYQENPINVNSEDVVHLEEIDLLSAFQVKALLLYRRRFGDLVFADELLMVDGFNETIVAVITPLLRFGKSEFVQEKEKITPFKAIAKGQHQVTLNYAEKVGEAVNEDYLGSPRKIQMKYNYHYGQKLRFGIVTEKDAGEPRLFDFVGAHLFATDLRLWGHKDSGYSLVVKDLALGDYLLSFGQGLTLWSGTSFGKGGSSPMKRGAGVRPKASANEGKFFRGAATTLRYRDFYATVFYSNRHIDATVVETDTLDEPELVSALQETGYHRTMNEIAKRNAIRQQVFGGHLCLAGPQFELGYTFYHLHLSAPLSLKPNKYNQFYFQGDRLTAMGLDFRWIFDKTAFFGEFSRSDNGAFAGLVGMTMKPTGYINFSILYRNYDKRYQSLFNSAYGESSRRQGEEGCYLGMQLSPAAEWDLLAYCDFFRLTWLNSQAYNPSWGQEYNLRLTHQINHKASIQLRFKSKTKMKNSSDGFVFSHYPIFYTKRSVSFQISYNITEDLVFSDKAFYSHYLNDDGANSKGYLLCHDVAYKPPDKPYSLTLRYALFDSDDYQSRVSMYENDVLGAFSIPSFTGTGTRVYLLGKLKLFGCLSLYSKVGITLFTNETKVDLKAELIWKK